MQIHHHFLLKRGMFTLKWNTIVLIILFTKYFFNFHLSHEYYIISSLLVIYFFFYRFYAKNVLFLYNGITEQFNSWYLFLNDKLIFYLNDTTLKWLIFFLFSYELNFQLNILKNKLLFLFIRSDSLNKENHA